jgi:hypothetical protein
MFAFLGFADNTWTGTTTYGTTTRTGDVVIGTNTPGTIGAPKLEIKGITGNYGPHIQTIASDNLPLLQILSYSHDNVSLSFDAYWDNSKWRSSHDNSNFQIYKQSNKLSIRCAKDNPQTGEISWTDALVINNDGEVSIGTLVSPPPTVKLHVVDNTNTANQLNITDVSGNYGLVIGKNHTTQSQTSYHGDDWAHVINFDPAPLVLGTDNLARVIIDGNGVVQIGDEKFDGAHITPGTLKLSVDGTIVAQEILINAETAHWSDFVFKPDYELPSLKKVENFIEKNGHLPEIPSEKEVKKNGINIGEMNAKLLQKIEELTLYAIAQNKRIEEQEKKIEMLMHK